MKKIWIPLLIILVVLLAGGVGYLSAAYPRVDKAPELRVEQTPDRIRRGEYLANHVAACMDCHSARDWSRLTGPLVPGTLGQGGEYFGPEMGFPGSFYSKNLTPAHLGDWTDGEIFRAITSGVSRDGSALFPVMPYLFYGKADREDILDIIAYLRSLPPIDHATPESDSKFPMNVLIRTFPVRPEFSQKPSPENKVEYGGYLVKMAACMDCHTQVKKGKPVLEKSFAGGREFQLPGGMLHSANITPDPETGIGRWSEETFVKKFWSFSDPEHLPAAEGYNTLMPWSMYAGMTNQDLSAIYAYLMSLPPVNQKVVVFAER